MVFLNKKLDHEKGVHMKKQMKERHYSFLANLVSIVVGALVVIVSYLFMRYFGLVTPAAIGIIGAGTIFYGIFFDRAAMNYLNEIYSKKRE
jgi:hypothetical protein